MIDIDEMRKRYATQAKKCDNCKDGLGYLVPCGFCGYVEGNNLGDPAVLALCDEVESLRAQVQDLEAQLADRNARLYDLAHPDDTGHPSPDDAPHTDDPFWLPDDL